MSEEREKGAWAWCCNNWPLSFAAILTAGFLIWTSWIFTRFDCGLVNCESRIDQFLKSSNNEMGDTLAGFVGSLTLIWVVASVLQQSMELRAQRREFAEMVRAQDAQVRALEAQADFLKLEAQDRKQLDVKRQIELILSLASDLSSKFGGSSHWLIKGESNIIGDRIEEETIRWNPYTLPILGFNERDSVARIPDAVARFRSKIQAGGAKPRDDRKSALGDVLKQIIYQLTRATQVSEGLEGSYAEWFRAMRISETIVEFEQLLECDLWDPDGWQAWEGAP